MEKPRILILVVGFTMGGAERLILDICKTLQKDFLFLVVALKGDGPLKRLLAKEGIESFGLGGSYSFDIRIIRRFNRVIKQFNPQIINTHLFKANWFGRIMGIVNHIPVISTVHNITLYLNLFQKQIEKLTAPLATINICCSKYVCLDNSKIIRYPYKNYIYNGVEISLKKQNILFDPFRLVVVSRIDLKQKALVELVQAINILHRNGRHFFLDIYGDGKDKGTLLHFIKQYNLERYVTLKGFVLNPEEVLPSYSIFVLPSKFEGLPLAILEAISKGLIVVASNVGGVPEIIEDGETGFLIDGYSPESIAHALTRVLEHRNDLPRIAENSRRKLEKVFNLEKTVVHWKNLYNYILKHHSAEGLSDLIPHT